MKVDKDRLHELFMSGMLMADIAKELGIRNDYCQSIISKERKKNPDQWPKRKDTWTMLTTSIPTTPMHLYECTDCFCTFGVEDYEEGIDQSVVICPHCHTDEMLEDRGYGYFIVTIPAKEEAS